MELDGSLARRFFVALCLPCHVKKKKKLDLVVIKNYPDVAKSDDGCCQFSVRKAVERASRPVIDFMFSVGAIFCSPNQLMGAVFLLSIFDTCCGIRVHN
jgi:hypothetical protein